MALNESQVKVLDQLLAFVDGDGTALSLQGGAGVGKTYLVSEFVKRLLADGWRVGVAAPTHKACRVLRAKLDAAGIPWAFKPQGEELPCGKAICDTTAALLGVRPMIDDDQDEDELRFKASGSGSLIKLLRDGARVVLVVDEVSMVGRDDLLALKLQLARCGAKLVAVGDEGQLPPVKKQAISFAEDFEEHAVLTEVVRQAKGSSIVRLAWAVRGSEGFEYANLSPFVNDVDVVHQESVHESFVSQLEAPVDDESRRSVYIAYRNVVVDHVQRLACERLYGHDHRTFRAGELVLAQTPGYRENIWWVGNDGVRRLSKWPKMEQQCAVADQLRVRSISDDEDPMLGRRVELERVDLPAGAGDRSFSTHYLSGEQLSDQAHPFSVRRAELLASAKELQAKFKAGERALDEKRKAAWGEFFKHGQKVISFAHPFAITSHKSQGSTYRDAFVNVSDLLRHNRRALYVAVTRPSQRLVV